MTKNYNSAIIKITATAILIALVIWFVIWAKSLLVPMVFGVILTLLIMPVNQWLEGKGVNRILSAALSMFVLLLLLGLLGFLIGKQFVHIFENMDSINAKIKEGIARLFKVLRNEFGMNQAEIEAKVDSITDSSIGYLSSGIFKSTGALLNGTLVIIYTFLLTIYRSAFKQFAILQFASEARDQARETIEKIQKMMINYMGGWMVMILFLGSLGSLGLWLIGIDYPLFWGFLAAFLAIIPYLGTAIGMLLPTIFALSTTSTTWQPLATLGLFIAIQQIEGNFFTPKILGSSVKINALASIVVLIFGNLLWGIPGMIIAIPCAAVVRIIFEQVPQLKPIAALLNQNIYTKQKDLTDKYGERRNSIINLFRKKIKP